MKKIILSLFLTLVSFSLFAFDAQVLTASGKTEVKNGNSWIALKVGDSVSSGAVIQTGFKSELVLKIKESTVTVAPLSRVTIQSLVSTEGSNGKQGKDSTTIKLDTGSLKSNVQKSQDRRVGFTVRSPVATASVRGTEFTLTSKYKSVQLQTSRGSVAFWKNTAQTESVLDGQDKEAEEEKEVAESEADESAENTDSGDQDLSDFSPASAVMVAAGEAAKAATGFTMQNSYQTASKEAVSVGSGTETAASAENTLSAETGTSSGTGVLVVNVSFADD